MIMQSALKNIQRWCLINNLVVSPQKAVSTYYSLEKETTGRYLHTIVCPPKISAETVQKVDELKYLEVIFNRKLQDVQRLACRKLYGCIKIASKAVIELF